MTAALKWQLHALVAVALIALAREIELRDRVEDLALALPDLASGDYFVPRADLLPAAAAPAPKNSHLGVEQISVALHRELDG